MKKFILLCVCCWAISLTYASSLSQSNLQAETDTIYLEGETSNILNIEKNKWCLDAWSGQYKFNLTWLSETKTGVFDKEDLAAGRYNNYLWQYDESYSRILTKYTFEEVDLVVKYVPMSGLIHQLNIDAKIKAVDKDSNVAYFHIHVDREDLFAKDTIVWEVPNADKFMILGDSAFVMQGMKVNGGKVSVSLFTTEFQGIELYYVNFNRPQTYVEYYENGDTIRYEAIKDDYGLAVEIDNANIQQNNNIYNLDATFLAADTVVYKIKMIYDSSRLRLITSTNSPERGTTHGDTIALPNTEVQISATANYGYHFTQWNDGNTDNPRTILLTKDIELTAQFEKNQYTITTTCNKAQGVISGIQVAEYLDEVKLMAIANVGYHFTRWADGNTDNPRTFILTQDTTFMAEVEMDYSGKCGDDLYWAYSNKEVKITGTGAMYNYTDGTMPWTLLRDSIMTVRVGNNATSIGEYAFANTPKLAKLYIGANVADIGAYAFTGCRRLYDIYCYPTYPPFAESNSFANYGVYLYIPCDYQRSYKLDLVWKMFLYIECIGSEDVVVPDNEVTVSPNYEDATFTWPVTDGADTYSLVITKDDITFCTLVFNAQGQLVSIAFKPRRQNAPAEEGTTPATYAEMTANGFRFTVTGLDEGSAYAYTFTVRNAANSVLETYTGEFTTLSNTPTAISNSPDTTETVSEKGAEKVLRNGQVLILRNGETYDMMGQRL